jgi:hypothetical protein
MAMPVSTLKEKLYRGARDYFVITMYLWVIFVLFDIYRSVLVAQYHIDDVAKSFALINALALAKIALIAREFKLDARLRPKGKPLIYPTLLNAGAFAVLLAAFKMLEEVAVGLYHGRSFAASLTDWGGGALKGIVCLAGIFFVMLIPFFAFSELGIVLGDGKLARLFFAEHPDSGLAKSSA